MGSRSRWAITLATGRSASSCEEAAVELKRLGMASRLPAWSRTRATVERRGRPA